MNSENFSKTVRALLDKIDVEQKENIDKAVREAITESIRKGKTLERLIENTLHQKLVQLSEDDEKNNKKRAVLQWLQQDEVNTAAIRRELEGDPESQEEEDSKRSYFMKKVNQTNGKDFSDNEVNQLYAIKSGLGQ